MPRLSSEIRVRLPELSGGRSPNMADLDHTTVQAPYLRLNDTHPTPNGDVVALWDFRITQPNQARVDPHVMHSTEHALICALRQFHPRAFLAAPMGCGTGLYITAINITD